ncbi:Response regulator receiver domain-containing protein [Streptomyces sp. DvalAA-14]|uniref:fused response regulator/phosphatase n=1 Tax=unclassified Streptomyces TaxID=2593676 RepID=UPI00081B8AC5|nr:MULTISPECIES: fused response regulator/phosphatase [unclassified Streptomyces]MYS23531.1 SpoIIE family protein phosphatase [Streptomyces sp. SID4948]SCE34834.1 Response regulator receiver domain-containing protein [Streptomyces sp. DvalAA-14]
MNSYAAVDTEPALILVVDDNPTNRYIITACLRRAGHAVLEAADGTGALALLHTADPLPDAAIVDVRLPDMTGFEVCERIKADPDTAAVPVIHISASAITVTDRTQGLNRGADAYLTEPIAPDELLATVTATLRYARARRRAETLAERLGRLNRATLALYGAGNAAALARGTALGAAGIFGAAARVVLTSPQGRLVQAVGAAGEAATVTEPAAAEVQALLQSHPLGGATGVGVHMMPAAGDTPALAVAMARVKAGRPPLCIAVPDRGLTADDHELLTQLAHASALSLEALRSYTEEHTLALTLQRTFLPVSLPSTERAELAVRYLPASETTEIGGDFYEALTVRDGLIVAVGDVAGHSLDAAVVMGELRHALRAYALEGHPPHVIAGHLEHLLHRLNPHVCATLCIMLIESGDSVQIANAGHLPPVLRAPDGRTWSVREHGPMLGLGLPHPPAVRVAAPPGSQIVMVTDGLLERRGTDIADSLAELEEAVAKGPADVEDICDHLLARFPPDGNDDVALLAVRLRRSAPGSPP